jgi:hypothetical protein
MQGTIEIWMKQGSIDAKMLIPSLLEYESSGTYVEDLAIRYLEFTIFKQGNGDIAVHNYLVWLYVGYEDETGVLAFLKSQKGKERFDFQYALRLFHQKAFWYSTIQVFGIMEMYEQAVDLALKVCCRGVYKQLNDMELACMFADRPEEDVPLQKRLWLKIARHVVEDKQDIKK